MAIWPEVGIREVSHIGQDSFIQDSFRGQPAICGGPQVGRTRHHACHLLNALSDRAGSLRAQRQHDRMGSSIRMFGRREQSRPQCDIVHRRRNGPRADRGCPQRQPVHADNRFHARSYQDNHEFMGRTSHRLSGGGDCSCDRA